MTHLNLFLIQVALCLTCSALVITLLNRQLRELLAEICGTTTRAAFWVTFTQLMLVIAPLLLVIFFADLRPGVMPYPAEALKDAVFRSLFAIFIAIAIIGRIIRKAVLVIPATGTAATPALKAD